MNVRDVLDKLNQLKATWAFTQESQFHSLGWAIRRGEWSASIATFALRRRDALLDILSPEWCPAELTEELDRLESIFNKEFTSDDSMFDVSGITPETDSESRFFEGGVTPLRTILRSASVKQDDFQFSNMEHLHHLHLLRQSVSSELETIVDLKADKFTEFELENAAKLEKELAGL